MSVRDVGNFMVPLARLGRGQRIEGSACCQVRQQSNVSEPIQRCATMVPALQAADYSLDLHMAIRRISQFSDRIARMECWSGVELVSSSLAGEVDTRRRIRARMVGLA